MLDISEIWQALTSVWVKGGGLMGPISIMALLIYGEGFRVALKVALHPMSRLKKGSKELDPKQRAWLERVSRDEHQHELDDQRLAQTRKALHDYYQRRIKWLGRFIKCCPLLGLLGTVLGMEATFQSLLETGLSQAEGMAAGISEALITTQYGLMVTIPGLFVNGFIKNQVSIIDRNILRLHLISFHHIVPKVKRPSHVKRGVSKKVHEALSTQPSVQPS